MISTEKAFDLLPHMVDIFDKLEIKEYVQQNKGKENDAEKAGYELILYIMRKAPKVKDEVIRVVASIEEKPEEEIRKQSIFVTIKSFKELLEADGMMDFFSSAMGSDTEKA